jgi:hypothetical protein
MARKNRDTYETFYAEYRHSGAGRNVARDKIATQIELRFDSIRIRSGLLRACSVLQVKRLPIKGPSYLHPSISFWYKLI